jgi:hypothetical protein
LSLLWRLTTPILMLGIGWLDYIWNTMFRDKIRLCKLTFLSSIYFLFLLVYIFSVKEMHICYAKNISII